MTTTELTRTIAEIRRALRERSGKAWSVTKGHGTVYGWITVTAPPARLVGYGMTDADRAELRDLLGLDFVHQQGVLIPASNEYRLEYVARARGEQPTVYGKPYWD